MIVVEKVSGDLWFRAELARRILTRHEAAAHADAAIAEFPGAPVFMESTRSSTAITYEVFIGYPAIAEDPHRRGPVLWRRVVPFGHDCNSRAGGHHFVSAARDQQAIAFAAATLVHLAKGKS